MTLSYTLHLKLAVPDFLSEPWHSEFATAMDSIDRILYDTVLLQNTAPWENSHAYTVGTTVISPDNGGIYVCAVAHTSSPTPTTFTQEQIAHPTFWGAFATTLATQAEAEAGIENTHYMSPLRTKQAITAQAFATAIATQAQAEAGIDNITAMSPLRATQHEAQWSGVPQCGKLARVTAGFLSFLPFNGDVIKINGALYKIPSVGNGIAGLINIGAFLNGVAGQNLAVNTTYFVYAFVNAGVVTADFRTGGHETSLTTGNIGVETLIGDNTRTLIGMVRTDASAQFVNTLLQRFVINWFNRGSIALRRAWTIQTTTTSGTFVELSSANRLEFLCWATSNVMASHHAYVANSVNDGQTITGIGLDGVTGASLPQLMWFLPASTVNWLPVALTVALDGIADGYHYISIHGAVSGGTGSWGLLASSRFPYTSATVNL